jgi:two-component system alkaline phosphatase synthesis response regulator PhoP
MKLKVTRITRDPLGEAHLMIPTKILLIDDDMELTIHLSNVLADEGYKVKVLSLGQEALSIAADMQPDLILLDCTLPDRDGFELCSKLKNVTATRTIPLILIPEERVSEREIVTALELGADDVVPKPLNTKVLLAKIRVGLRRRLPVDIVSEDIIKLHSIYLDKKKYRVYVSDQEVKLTTTEFKLLECLISKPGFALTREQIVTELNDKEYPITLGSIDVHIAGLRKKLGSAATYLETLRGIGYRMKDADH